MNLGCQVGIRAEREKSLIAQQIQKTVRMAHSEEVTFAMKSEWQGFHCLRGQSGKKSLFLNIYLINLYLAALGLSFRTWNFWSSLWPVETFHYCKAGHLWVAITCRIFARTWDLVPWSRINPVQTSKAAGGASALVWMLSKVFRSSLIFEINPHFSDLEADRVMWGLLWPCTPTWADLNSGVLNLYPTPQLSCTVGPHPKQSYFLQGPSFILITALGPMG